MLRLAVVKDLGCSLLYKHFVIIEIKSSFEANDGDIIPIPARVNQASQIEESKRVSSVFEGDG